MELREAVAADLSAVVALERSCEGAPHWSGDIWRAMLLHQPPVERTVLLAERQTQLLGFAVVALVTGVASLESIAVQAASRGQGIGRTLGGAAMAWARAQGASAMELEVRASNTSALRLYRSLGFAEQGRRPRYYTAPVEDAVWMAIALS